MSDEKPVLEQDETELKQTLVEVLFAHKASIDVMEAGLRSQKVLVDQLYDHFHSQNDRVNEIVARMNKLDEKFKELGAKLDGIESQLIAALCKVPAGPMC
jgi:hypothetical protein